MTREAYLQELWGRLSNRLPRQELENVVRYYEEYFDEAGPQREAEVIAELGTPEALVAQIMGERVRTQPVEVYGGPERAGGWTAGRVVLVSLCPVWVPVLAGLLCAAAAVTLALFLVPVLLAGAGVVCVGVGGAVALGGISALFSPGIATVVFFLGTGLLAAGVGLLLLLCGIWTAVGLWKGVGAAWRWCWRGTRSVWGWTFLGRRTSEVAA